MRLCWSTVHVNSKQFFFVIHLHVETYLRKPTAEAVAAGTLVGIFPYAALSVLCCLHGLSQYGSQAPSHDLSVSAQIEAAAVLFFEPHGMKFRAYRLARCNVKSKNFITKPRERKSIVCVCAVCFAKHVHKAFWAKLFFSFFLESFQKSETPPWDFQKKVAIFVLSTSGKAAHCTKTHSTCTIFGA